MHVTESGIRILWMSRGLSRCFWFTEQTLLLTGFISVRSSVLPRSHCITYLPLAAAAVNHHEYECASKSHDLYSRLYTPNGNNLIDRITQIIIWIFIICWYAHTVRLQIVNMSCICVRLRGAVLELSTPYPDNFFFIMLEFRVVWLLSSPWIMLNLTWRGACC